VNAKTFQGGAKRDGTGPAGIADEFGNSLHG
jgi:hypothetical protein